MKSGGGGRNDGKTRLVSQGFFFLVLRVATCKVVHKQPSNTASLVTWEIVESLRQAQASVKGWGKGENIKKKRNVIE